MGACGVYHEGVAVVGVGAGLWILIDEGVVVGDGVGF